MSHDLRDYPMVLQGGCAAESVRQLVRARRLLAAGFDEHRAIVGRVSREWILSEAERRIPWERLPPPLQERFRPAGGPPPARVNTNWLPKLEPALNGSILAAVMLFGTRIFGSGTPDPETGAACREIDFDLVIASLILGTFQERDGCSAFLPERRRRVDESYLAAEFGEGILTRVWELRERLALFDMALRSGDGALPSLAPEYANAIAAVKAARLRLTARAAGDGIFALLDEAKREELRGRGIDPDGSGEAFPERACLERDYEATRAAIGLPGVDAAIREPVRDVLLRSVEHVLHHGTSPRELVGKYGSAVRNFHCALPLWEHFSPINRRTVPTAGGGTAELMGPFALGSLFLTSLEVTRYLHNVRRKGGRTGAGHSFLVASRVERLLGENVSVPVVAGSDCHDVVEDGGFASAGYDQDLELFACRFGAPLAALVAEVTDSFAREDGPRKAEATARHASLVPLEQAYNLGQLAELRARATDPGAPYTLQGIIMKIADFGSTQEEGLLDPDLMTGPWRHSGARFTWDHYSKGRIVGPLLERLRVEVLLSRTDPFYHERVGSLPPDLIARLREVLAWSFEVADLYAAQNLTILAGEHALEPRGRASLLELFFGEGGSSERASDRLGEMLPDGQIDPEVRRKGLAATYRLVPGADPVRDLSRLEDYHAASRWRLGVRNALDLPPLDRARLEEVVQRTVSALGLEGRP